MAQVKAVVSVLCDLLQFMGIGDLKPEILRCAKFNKPTSEGPLVRSLRNVLQLRFKVALELDIDTREKEMVFISSEMMKWGYLKASFYKQLENLYRKQGHVQKVDGHVLEQDCHVQESESSCSQALLLAFVWLLHKMKIFETYSVYVHHCFTFLTQSLPSTATIKQIDETLKNLLSWWKWTEEQYQFRQHNVLRKIEKHHRVKDDCPITSLIQQLLAVRNRIATTARALYSAESGYAKLSHKVHTATHKTTPHNNGFWHLSLNEVYLLRHPDLLKKSIHLLGKLTKRLETLVVWSNQEILFWQWMESIIDAAQTEEQTQTPLFSRMTTDTVPTAITQLNFSVQKPFLWCVHLQWFASHARKPPGYREEERPCLASKIKEVDTNIIQLETQLRELHSHYSSDIEHLKRQFPGITFETTDLKIGPF
jgi:hypothetical protein